MKPFLRLPFYLLALLTLAGCQSFPPDRIAAHQAEFNTWPPDVQAKVRAGLVDVGYTQDQVFIALGEPSTKTQAGYPGNLSEVWIYHRRAARFGFAVGGASFGRGGGVAGGASVNGLKLGVDTDGEVIFLNGRLTSVHIYTR
jgi:hypothetical protein